jgi:hypothetical protein
MEEEVKEEVKEEVEEEVKEGITSEQKDEGSREEQKEEEKPLDKMTVKELREIAIDIPGVTGVIAMKKEEVLAIIKEYRGITDEKPVKKKKIKTKKPALSMKELKEKAATLREDKKAISGAKNRKKVAILRKRINRLKKQTRKVAIV